MTNDPDSHNPPAPPRDEGRAAKLVGALVWLGFCSVLGGVTWAWFGGGALFGGWGALVAFVAWPLLGVVVLLVSGAADWISAIKLRVPIRGVETVSDLLVALVALAFAAALLALIVGVVVGG